MSRNVLEFTSLALSEAVAAVFFNHATSTQLTIEASGTNKPAAQIAVRRESQEKLLVTVTISESGVQSNLAISGENFDQLVDEVFTAVSGHLSGQVRVEAKFSGLSLEGSPLKNALGNSDDGIIVQVDNLDENGSATILDRATRLALSFVEHNLDKSARIRVTTATQQWPTWVEFSRLPSNGSILASTNDADLFVGAPPSLFVSDVHGELTRQRALSYLQGEFEQDAQLCVTLFLDSGNGNTKVLEGTSQSGRLVEQVITFDI